jgi:hypothetical protein
MPVLPHQYIVTRRLLRPRVMLRRPCPVDPRAVLRLVPAVDLPLLVPAVLRAAPVVLLLALAVPRLPAVVVLVARPHDDGVVLPLPVRLPAAVRRPCPAVAAPLAARRLAPTQAQAAPALHLPLTKAVPPRGNPCFLLACMLVCRHLTS